MREFDCVVHLSTPKPGMKTIVRSDNNEFVREEPMTPAEMQADFGRSRGRNRSKWGDCLSLVPVPVPVPVRMLITGARGVGNVTASLPIVAGGTPDNITLNFGFNFTSTVTGNYTVVKEDCGYIKRFNSTGPLAVALPRLAWPCVLIFFNDNTGPVTVTPAEVDINGDKSVVIQNQEGLLLSMHAGNAFWRGLYTTGRVQSGTGQPASARCSAAGVGQVYVRTDAKATSSSLFVCAQTGQGIYAWELVSGAIPPTGAIEARPTGYSDLTDFKATADSTTRLTITPGMAAIGSYSLPAAAGGTVTFTAGTEMPKYTCRS